MQLLIRQNINCLTCRQRNGVGVARMRRSIAILIVYVEALNTAIERLCDHITPDIHPAIGHIKDIAAAAVLLTALTAVAAGLCIFVPAIIDKVTQLS